MQNAQRTFKATAAVSLLPNRLLKTKKQPEISIKTASWDVRISSAVPEKNRERCTHFKGSRDLAARVAVTMDCIYNLLTSKDRYEDNFEESDEFKSPEEEWNANRKYIKELRDVLTEGDNFNKVMKGIQQPRFFLCLTISSVRDKI